MGTSADTTQQAADTFFPGYAKAMTDVGKERGWPAMTRASFDAQRGRDGALLPQAKMMRAIDAIGARVLPALHQAHS
jgi:hypothetical protein